MNNETTLQLEWHCQAEGFGSLALPHHHTTFKTLYCSAKTRWDLRVEQAASGIWNALVSKSAINKRLRLIEEKPDAEWGLGPFESKEQAQFYAESFLMLRLDPATWRIQPALLPPFNFGQFSKAELDATFETNRLARQAKITRDIEVIAHAGNTFSAGAKFCDESGHDSFVCGGFAPTKDEAVGQLVASRPEVFGLSITVVSNPYGEEEG